MMEKEPKMELLFFLNELASIYRELHKDISLCYYMRHNELYAENLNGVKHQEIKPSLYKFRPKYIKSAFKEMIIEWNEDSKKVKCFYVHGMYFIPGEIDSGIIFAKSFDLVLQNSQTVKNAKIKTVGFKI